MNATQEVAEQYKQAARTYIEHINIKGNPAQSTNFFQGRMSGLAIALSCLGVTSDEIREIYKTCEEEVEVEEKRELEIIEHDRIHQAATDAANQIEREKEQEQEELDAIERPASQARVEVDESGEDIYECEHCNAEFRESEILRRDFGGETGGITFCPRCKEATKLICVTEVSK